MCYTFFDSDSSDHSGLHDLSLHDALPISPHFAPPMWSAFEEVGACRRADFGKRGSVAQGVFSRTGSQDLTSTDRKSTRLNSSHLVISYAVFRLKKKT